MGDLTQLRLFLSELDTLSDADEVALPPKVSNGELKAFLEVVASDIYLNDTVVLPVNLGKAVDTAGKNATIMYLLDGVVTSYTKTGDDWVLDQ